MGYYYKYNFVSPEGVYAIIKEELKAYYDTGAIDDLLFATYLNKALTKLGRATYSISEDFLYIDDFQARLPDNFYAVREAWRCLTINGRPYQSSNSFYSQAATVNVIQIVPITVDENSCTNPQYEEETNCDMPTQAQLVYKTNIEIPRTFTRDYLLKPGNISARGNCDVNYMDNWERHMQSTPHSSAIDSFDIRDNKFVTNFRTGAVNMVFYATDYDETGNQLIPDNFRIKEYIEAFIKFKMFETLTNQTNDETFNQLQQKLVYYKQLADEAFILANTELMKQTVWDKQHRIKQTANRLNMYELPTHSHRYGWRRNS
jgi:hypothetical protein